MRDALTFRQIRNKYLSRGAPFAYSVFASHASKKIKLLPHARVTCAKGVPQEIASRTSSAHNRQVHKRQRPPQVFPKRQVHSVGLLQKKCSSALAQLDDVSFAVENVSTVTE